MIYIFVYVCVINLDYMRNLLIINLSFLVYVMYLFSICDECVIHKNRSYCRRVS